MTSAPTVIDLVEAYRAHDEYAATLLYRRYARALLDFADRQIGTLLRQTVAAEDVVQVVFHTFFRHVRSGRYRFNETSGVWNLLATMTRNRIRQLACRCRPAMRIYSNLHVPPNRRRASHVANVELRDNVEAMLRNLPPRCRPVLLLRLQGHTIQETADLLGCSRWTVRRCLNLFGQQPGSRGGRASVTH